MSSTTDSLRSATWQSRVAGRPVYIALGVIAFVLATAFGAQVAVRLPWTPVPVTFQPLFVVLAGVVLGARAGAVAMVAYVTIGALGAPVFSNGGAGVAWLLGPTGGYLFAAPAAAFVAGIIAGREGRSVRLLTGLTAGTAVMYLGGVSQLALVTGQGWAAAFALGAVPFLLGDVTKILFAFAVVAGLRKVVEPPSSEK
jgi:biotin transport system substrate-specific component